MMGAMSPGQAEPHLGDGGSPQHHNQRIVAGGSRTKGLYDGHRDGR